MPKDTFYNLPESKRNDFIQTALLEFSQHNYETASINRIIHKLGIARGSVYQYFKDKLELWLFIKEYAEGIKMGYIQSVNRADFNNFWEYYRQLFIRGLDFDLEQPLCSKFLYRIGFKEGSREVEPFLNGWKDKAKQAMRIWVEAEQKEGGISKDLPPDLIVHFLITSTISIAELLQEKYKLNFEQNLESNTPLYGHSKAEVIAAANDLIKLFEKALK